MSAACHEPDYPVYVERLRAAEPALADELAGFTSVEHVLGWMQGRGLAGAAVDIVGQDEFNYDFLVEVEKGGRWLAFGVSWLGALTAVAVWQRKPSADELLAARLADGWRPTPTALKTGPAVLGHAACAAAPPR